MRHPRADLARRLEQAHANGLTAERAAAAHGVTADYVTAVWAAHDRDTAAAPMRRSILPPRVPLRPCGTRAAAVRHRRYGETCIVCAGAIRTKLTDDARPEHDRLVAAGVNAATATTLAVELSRRARDVASRRTDRAA